MIARLVVAALLAISPPAHAANIQPNSFAWGENIGWVNFAPAPSGGVTVTNSGITGFAWSENFGWINFAPTSGGVVNNGAGVLSGFAWSENAGWINFGPMASGGVITTWRPSGGAPSVTGSTSRKTHGAAGTFDLPLTP